ncbi:hypothetical protein LSAT2_026260 [Lamellibrachia satsuma]|nr:hypothetical protein LSAT2_026260 [Lamellibrachia satsuma]
MDENNKAMSKYQIYGQWGMRCVARCGCICHVEIHNSRCCVCCVTKPCFSRNEPSHTFNSDLHNTYVVRLGKNVGIVFPHFHSDRVSPSVRLRSVAVCQAAKCRRLSGCEAELNKIKSSRSTGHKAEVELAGRRHLILKWLRLPCLCFACASACALGKT